ncbi:MAG: hypothetical protein ABR549_03890 [Mycobacteriales bacterium]
MARTTSRALAGLAVAGLAVLSAAPAIAAPPGPGCAPERGRPAYPPGQCKKPAVSDSTVTPGEPLTASSGEGQFDKGKKVKATGHSTPFSIATTSANSAGEAVVTFTVPSNLPAGQHSVVFTGPFFGTTRSVSVPFTVVGSTSASDLPFTGFQIGAASLLGVGLVGAGTISVLAGRRRKALVPA